MQKMLIGWRKVQQGVTQSILTPLLAEEESKERPFHQKEEVRPLSIWTKKKKLQVKVRWCFPVSSYQKNSCLLQKIVTIKVMDVIV